MECREMIARVVKNIMRAEMRDKTKNVHWQRMAQAPSSSQPRIELGHAEEDHNQETSFAMVVARFFNVVIGLEGERSKEFWDVQMRYPRHTHDTHTRQTRKLTFTAMKGKAGALVPRGPAVASAYQALVGRLPAAL